MDLARVAVRRGALFAAVGLLVACGSTETAGSGDTVPASPTFQTNDTTHQLDIGTPAGTDPAEPAAAPADTSAGVITTDPAPEPTPDPAVDPGPEPAADPEPVVAPAVPGGRAFDAAVAPTSEIDSNQLPDLVVDDVRRGTKANFRNIFPADRPVLLWLWAPH